MHPFGPVLDLFTNSDTVICAEKRPSCYLGRLIVPSSDEIGRSSDCVGRVSLWGEQLP